jgi:hypothetical protein
VGAEQLWEGRGEGGERKGAASRPRGVRRSHARHHDLMSCFEGIQTLSMERKCSDRQLRAYQMAQGDDRARPNVFVQREGGGERGGAHVAGERYDEPVRGREGWRKGERKGRGDAGGSQSAWTEGLYWRTGGRHMCPGGVHRRPPAVMEPGKRGPRPGGGPGMSWYRGGEGVGDEWRLLALRKEPTDG